MLGKLSKSGKSSELDKGTNLTYLTYLTKLTSSTYLTESRPYTLFGAFDRVQLAITGKRPRTRRHQMTEKNDHCGLQLCVRDIGRNDGSYFSCGFFSARNERGIGQSSETIKSS